VVFSSKNENSELIGMTVWLKDCAEKVAYILWLCNAVHSFANLTPRLLLTVVYGEEEEKNQTWTTTDSNVQGGKSLTDE
jgi:hypothetical protein